MRTKASRALFLVLAIGLTASIVSHFLQNERLNSLLARLDEQNAQLKSLQFQVESQGKRILGLDTLLDIDQERQESAIKIRSLASGIYVLTSEIASDPLEEQVDEYVIYNFVLDISVGAVKRKLQFGYGSSGYFTHVIYFDHDSDGFVDVELMQEFSASIPGLDFASDWLIDPAHAQTVYDAFRTNVDSAVKINVDDVSSDANQQVARLWTWLNEQSADLTEWLEESIAVD